MNETEERVFADLNPPQREAVATLEGPLLILAGAGSGKTRVVTRRIANLIAHGARPWEILAITFTNKAAAEMRRRVEDLVGQAGVWLSTFHSFCARVLRREAEVLGYTRDFTIYDEEDSLSLVKDIVKRLGLEEDKRFSARNVRQAISRTKNSTLRGDELPQGLFHERVLSGVFEEYEAALRKNQGLDFDDLLRQAVVLFTDHPDVLERYRNRFRYVLVDEYQDTNRCQYHLIQLLGQKHRNVCATGDPDQSIYAWRGADVRNILSFEKDFPEAKIVKLEQNYRSTQHILQTVAADEQLEAYEVARHIEEQVRAGRRYSDIAVFYRTNAQSRALEEALKNNVPHIIIGGVTFYERREVKDALAYLRLLVNPKDDVSFRRIINVPRRAVGDSALALIEQQALKTGASLLATLSGPEGAAFIATFKPKPRQGLTGFVGLLEELRALPPYPVADIVKTMLERSELRESLVESGEMERVENLDGLVNAAAEFDEENDPAAVRAPEGPPPEPGAYDGLEELSQRQASLAGFLEKVALMAPTDKYDPEKEYVTLMTLHMAKGLEFPVVFITGVEEGLLPLLRSGGPFEDRSSEQEAKALEEERRLVYVGMTRAKEKLYLSRAVYRRRYGAADIAQPSRFLSEITEKLLEIHDRSKPLWAEGLGRAGRGARETAEREVKAFGRFEREVAEVFGNEQKVPPRRTSSRRRDPALEEVVDRLLDTSEGQTEPSMLDVGDRVHHPKFGDGTVEAITGTGLSTKAKVHFRKCGPKLLLLSLAKLEKL
ncbi:MAG: UvrD-helicase domain-containing protein [Planctomycetota bacterium]|nr:UvrD-helicase domain-containing protein [Planctomycetota bacterium]